MDYLPKGNEDTIKPIIVNATGAASEMDYLPKGNEDCAQLNGLAREPASEMDYLPKGNEDTPPGQGPSRPPPVRNGLFAERQ